MRYGRKQAPEGKQQALSQNVHQQVKLVGQKILTAKLVTTEVFGVFDAQLGVTLPSWWSKEKPLDPSTLNKFRRRIGTKGMRVIDRISDWF